MHSLHDVVRYALYLRSLTYLVRPSYVTVVFVAIIKSLVDGADTCWLIAPTTNTCLYAHTVYVAASYCSCDF